MKSLAAKFHPADRVTRFLNVDLELAGVRAFPQLASELADRLFVLYSEAHGGLHRAHYEVTGPAKDADATIRALVRTIGRLSPTISARTLADVAAINGQLVLTTYAPQLER